MPSPDGPPEVQAFLTTLEENQAVKCQRRGCKTKWYPPGTQLTWVGARNPGAEGDGLAICDDCVAHYAAKAGTVTVSRTGMYPHSSSLCLCVLIILSSPEVREEDQSRSRQRNVNTHGSHVRISYTFLLVVPNLWLISSKVPAVNSAHIHSQVSRAQRGGEMWLNIGIPN